MPVNNQQRHIKIFSLLLTLCFAIVYGWYAVALVQGHLKNELDQITQLYISLYMLPGGLVGAFALGMLKPLAIQSPEVRNLTFTVVSYLANVGIFFFLCDKIIKNFRGRH